MSETAKISNSINIRVGTDGVYLDIVKQSFGISVSKADVVSLIDKYKIQDVDISAVNSALKDPEENISVKISDNTNVFTGDEKLEVTVSKDKMEAYAMLFPPGLGGKELTEQDLFDNIDKFGIKFGLIEDNVRKLIRPRIYNMRSLIATGEKPQDGKDGYVEYLFDTQRKKHAPKLLEDGNVDFHSLNYFESVKDGQVLVKFYPPQPGVNGSNVFGGAIFHKPGKLPPKVLRGKNVSLSADQTCLVSDVTGHLEYAGGRVSVSSVLDVPSDVGTATGDIIFDGAVIVRGGVMTGYTVSANGSVEVYGSVEGATITSKQDIILYKGIQGFDKAFISADGNIMISFAEKASLSCEGNIIANSLLNCNIKCGGEILVEGKKGTLIGGNIQAGESVTASVIGSPMAAVTSITVGNSPQLIAELERSTEELENAMANFEKIKAAVNGLMKLNVQGKLDNQKKMIFLKLVQEKTLLRTKINDLNERVVELNNRMSADTGFIHAKKRLFIGVKLTIGRATLYIDEETDGRMFKCYGGQIMILKG